MDERRESCNERNCNLYEVFLNMEKIELDGIGYIFLSQTKIKNVIFTGEKMEFVR